MVPLVSLKACSLNSARKQISNNSYYVALYCRETITDPCHQQMPQDMAIKCATKLDWNLLWLQDCQNSEAVLIFSFPQQGRAANSPAGKFR